MEIKANELHIGGLELVFTDVATFGFEIDLDNVRKLGNLTVYDYLKDEEIGEFLAVNQPDTSVLITNVSQLNENNMRLLKKLQLVCAASTGYDNIDVDYCKSRGIAVTNVPGYATDSVAQFTFAMLFHLRFSFSHETEFREISGKRWGIIGSGKIGTQVGQYAKSFGCDVVYHSVSGRANSPHHRFVSKEELISTSDIISIHVPLSESSRDFITIKEFEKMKKSAIILNLGRGGIINETDLAFALDRDLIYAAGLDVTINEPLEESSSLLKLKNPNKLLLTPHMAYGSAEARERLMEGVYESISSFINGGTLNRVDL